MIEASANFKLSVQGFFLKTFLQDEEKFILSLLSKNNVGVIANSHISPEFFSALIFEPVETDKEQSPTAHLYLPTSPPFYALKFLIYLFSRLQWYLNQTWKSHHLFCADPIKQAIWYINNDFCSFLVGAKKENKEVPVDFQLSIFNYCWAKTLLQR